MRNNNIAALLFILFTLGVFTFFTPRSKKITNDLAYSSAVFSNFRTHDGGPARNAKPSIASGGKVATPVAIAAPQGGGIGVAPDTASDAGLLPADLFCAAWNCTCQGFSDSFGTSHKKRSYGVADEHEQKWWNAYNCNTEPDPNHKESVQGGHHQRPHRAAHPFHVDSETEAIVNDENIRYLKFSWNGGRLNNNLMALAGALTQAKELNRTTIIEQPSAKPQGYSNAFYALIGLKEGLWDLEVARAHGFRYVFDHEVPKEVRNDQGCADISSDCRVVKLNDPFHWMKSFEDTRRSKPEVEDSVRHFLRPAEWIRQATDDFLKENFAPDGVPRISVHQRHHAWGHVEKHGSKYLCRGILKNMASSAGAAYRQAVPDWRPDDKAAQKKLLNITEMSCGLTYQELEAILEYFGQPPLGGKEKFFLATDREEMSSYNYMVQHGAAVIDPKTFVESDIVKQGIALALDTSMKLQEDCHKVLCIHKEKIVDLVLIMADMWAMSKGSFFVGGYFSTMSETVCDLRGQESMHASNYCFLASRMRAGEL